MRRCRRSGHSSSPSRWSPAAATTRRPRAGRRPVRRPTPSASAGAGPARPTHRPTRPTDDPALDPALSEPVEDSVYPDVGDPSVDSLHYDLDLAWTPDTRTLVGERDHRAPLDQRPATSSSSTSASRSRSAAVTLDGAEVAVRAPGQGPRGQRAGRRRTSGTCSRSATPAPPSPTPAPTTRNDFSTTRLDDHAGRRDVDDAGAVRRVHLVPRQRPALRQGALRLHASPCPRRGSASRTAS